MLSIDFFCLSKFLVEAILITTKSAGKLFACPTALCVVKNIQGRLTLENRRKKGPQETSIECLRNAVKITIRKKAVFILFLHFLLFLFLSNWPNDDDFLVSPESICLCIIQSIHFHCFAVQIIFGFEREIFNQFTS